MQTKNRDTGACENISFRAFRRGDGPSFRRCIEDFYGGGYPYPEYLEEDLLLEQCAAGNMLVLCGVRGDGEIVSTSAARMEGDFAGSVLLLLRVVRRAYRGMGVGKAQEERLLGMLAQREDVSSLYADVMTHDCVSQGSLARRGFVLCGIRLMLYRNRVMVPDLALDRDGKMSQAVMCRREHVRDVGSLYCPPEHELEVCRIYGELGVSCRILAAENAPCTERTEMSWEREPLHNTHIWMIRRTGRDFPELLRRGMLNWRAQWDTTVLCYLNMKDNAAVFSYRRLCEAGFFFTGIKPMQTGAEYLLLAFIGEQKIRYGDIHLYGQGELLAYIRANRQKMR